MEKSLVYSLIGIRKLLQRRGDQGLCIMWTKGFDQHERIAILQNVLLYLHDLFCHWKEYRHHKLVPLEARIIKLCIIKLLTGYIWKSYATGHKDGRYRVCIIVNHRWNQIRQVYKHKK